jgi:putative acyl-CoA dehydrogenase
MTPVTKYWVCKTAPSLAYEAMECLGGNGYVEDGGFPRLYREVPVNAIWEGSGNVMCLDVLRVVEREPDSFDKVLAEIEMAGVAEPRLKEALTRIKALARDVGRDQTTARTLVELLALAGAASLLASNAPHAMSDAFLATRLQGSWRNTYGAGIAHADTRAIVARAAPQHQ